MLAQRSQKRNWLIRITAIGSALFWSGLSLLNPAQAQAPDPAAELYVSNITASWVRGTGASQKKGVAIVDIVDGNGSPVNGAVVVGNWSGCFKLNNDSDTTETVCSIPGFNPMPCVDGRAVIWGRSVSCSSKNCPFTFTITNVQKGGMTYVPVAGKTSSFTWCSAFAASSRGTKAMWASNRRTVTRATCAQPLTGPLVAPVRLQPDGLLQILRERPIHKDTAMFCVRGFAFTSASLVLLATVARAAQYSFINIADTRGSFEGVGLNGKVVSDAGSVAFTGYQGGALGTYVGSGGAVQQVVPDLSPPGFTTYGEALNESGAATFSGEQFGVRRILLFDSLGTRTVFEHIVVPGANNYQLLPGNPAINNSGAVAFIVGYRQEQPWSSQGTVNRWTDGNLTTLVETTDGFSDILRVGINDVGDVAFIAEVTINGEQSYYRTDGTTLTLIAGPFPSETAFQSSNAGPIINDSGAVAFLRRLEAGGEGIFVGDGGPLTTVAIADPTTPFSEFEAPIDINNQGTVAFTALLWDGTYGIYTGSDPVNDKLVQIGDYLFGQQVRSLGRPHLNNRGDIAFGFEVRDPRDPSGYWSGIALAVKQASLPGDFNHDGAVDAADYVLWRKNAGGIFTENDYTTWRAHFGQTTGSGSSTVANAAVPEPSTLVMQVLAAASVCSRRRRAA